MHKCIKSLLIIDDQPANLKVLLDFLKEESFRVYIADSGERALSTLENIEPDLILLDVMMPGLDGFATCAKIKENIQWINIPIIFMTALDDIDDKLTAFKVGGVDYITKPFHQVEVLARINTHLILRQRELELQKALDEISELRSIIPICSSCKSIRDDEGFWSKLEAYMSKHVNIKFTHGICPDCARKLYPELFKDEGQE
jgi:DNA-binding response OmpR family regulator